MKTAAKVFIILGMVVQCILIYPIIVGVLALKKLKTATTVDELKTMFILTLLFVNTIAGILMLCMKDGDLQNTKQIEIESGTVLDENKYSE